MPARVVPELTFFFAAAFIPAPLGLEGRDASSAASWASRSAFLRADSAFLASAWSLWSSLLAWIFPLRYNLALRLHRLFLALVAKLVKRVHSRSK